MGLLIDLRPAAGPALVVGGGAVAARKVRNLAEAEFAITVIAPVVADEIRSRPFVTVIERAFEPGDLALGYGFSVVFVCTDDREVNRTVGRLARAAKIPVVVADAQEESTFFTPATLRDGDLAVAVSTGGASPALARQIRERIVSALGPGWAQILQTARTERRARQRARTMSERTDE
jgi:siroheme synthase-like protein